MRNTTMKTLIIYDSLYGNTGKVAQAVAKGLVGEVKILRVSETSAADLRSADVLIVGSPTHGGRPSQAMQQFLNAIPAHALGNVRAAAFDTGMPMDNKQGFIRFIVKFFGYASKRLASILKSKGAIIVAAETFFVLGKEGPLKQGELERAAAWAQGIIGTANRQPNLDSIR